MYSLHINHNRRAISNIIAALLLIAIAVAAAVLLYVFSIGLLGSLGSSGGQQTKDQLILEAYDWTGGTTLKLSLRNVGSSTLNIHDADYYINGQLQGTPGFSCASPSSVTPQSTACVATIAVTSGGTSLTSGVAYPIKVVTPDGGVFSYTAIDGQAS